MLNSIFFASTGGMFLVGFAMELGADNVLLGLISTVPQFFVAFQFAAAYLIEKGISRKKMTVVFSALIPACWLLIGAIPLFGPALGVMGRVSVLISVIALATLSGQFAGNARGSWIGDLIPADRRGRFFGYASMFGGLVGMVFAVGEGKFIDVVRTRGLFAFAALFFFGAIFGLVSAGLNLPQPDCPLPAAGRRSFGRHFAQTFRNRPFVMLALAHAVFAMGNIAAPFGPAYLIRDAGLSYFTLGLFGAVWMVAFLIASPRWGHLADRFGCRPVLVLGLTLLAPCGLVWLFIPPGAAQMAMILLPLANCLSGAAFGAFNVAINTLIYKLSHAEGRSVQLAAYGTFVGMVAAPMPLLGGWLVSALERAGYHVDLRLTFYAWTAFVALAAVLAHRLKEADSMPTRVLALKYLPARLWQVLGMGVPTVLGPTGALGWRNIGEIGDIERPDPAGPPAQPEPENTTQPPCRSAEQSQGTYEGLP
jgi:MFS family permease